MKETGEKALADLKAGTEMGLADMKTALEEAVARFTRSGRRFSSHRRIAIVL